MKILTTEVISGIGRQLALDYKNEGHQVWEVGRNKQALEELTVLGLQTGQVDLTDREARLARKKTGISFLKRFTYMLKLLAIFPPLFGVKLPSRW